MQYTRNSELASLIAGKTVALVGPAKYMENSCMGQKIDSHDLVVRINRGIESSFVHGNDIGSRTDIYYSCLIERAQQTGNIDADLLQSVGVKHIVAPPSSDMKGFSRAREFHPMVNRKKVEHLNTEIPVSIIDHNFNNDISSSVRCKPNTGFLAIYDLLRYDPKNIFICGFSFYLDGFISGEKSGVEKEKNCTEQQFSEMAFSSKRHVQVNMWNYAKETLLALENVELDSTLRSILMMRNFSKIEFGNICK